jgi:hypothetical protein
MAGPTIPENYPEVVHGCLQLKVAHKTAHICPWFPHKNI